MTRRMSPSVNKSLASCLRRSVGVLLFRNSRTLASSWTGSRRVESLVALAMVWVKDKESKGPRRVVRTVHRLVPAFAFNRERRRRLGSTTARSTEAYQLEVGKANFCLGP